MPANMARTNMLRLICGKSQPGKRLPPKLFGIEIRFGHGAL
jgi:hypothetical protein